MPCFTALTSNRLQRKKHLANCKVLHKQKRGIPFSSHISQRRLSLSHCQLFSHIRPFISRKCFSPTFAVSDYNDNNIPVLSTHRPTSFPHLWLAIIISAFARAALSFLLLPLCLLSPGRYFPPVNASAMFLRKPPWSHSVFIFPRIAACWVRTHPPLGCGPTSRLWIVRASAVRDYPWTRDMEILNNTFSFS